MRPNVPIFRKFLASKCSHFVLISYETLLPFKGKMTPDFKNRGYFSLVVHWSFFWKKFFKRNMNYHYFNFLFLNFPASKIWSHLLKKSLKKSFIFCPMLSFVLVLPQAVLLNQNLNCLSSHRRFFVRKVFLETSQNSQENTCMVAHCCQIQFESST